MLLSPKSELCWFILYKIHAVSCIISLLFQGMLSWASEGGKEISAKKVVWLVSSGKKQISPLLAQPLEKFWKNPLMAPLEKTLPTPMGALFFVRVWPGISELMSLKNVKQKTNNTINCFIQRLMVTSTLDLSCHLLIVILLCYNVFRSYP